MIATGPKDLRDKQWLDEQVADLGRGIDAAKAIWSNWWDGRQVGRLHPGMTPGQYIASLGMRLTLPEALAAMPDASTRQVAAVAGVSHMTVAREKASVTDVTDRVVGGDGVERPARVIREVTAQIIEEEPIESTDNTEDDLNAYYIKALRDYVAGIVNVLPSGLVLKSPPTLFRKRLALARALDRTIDEVLGL